MLSNFMLIYFSPFLTHSSKSSSIRNSLNPIVMFTPYIISVPSSQVPRRAVVRTTDWSVNIVKKNNGLYVIVERNT